MKRLLNRDIIIKFISDNLDIKDYKIKQNEIQINSIDKGDKKYHLGISLQSETLGLFNDFKPPQRSGDFIKLVKIIKNFKTYKEAYNYLLNNYIMPYYLKNKNCSIKFDIKNIKNITQNINNISIENQFPFLKENILSLDRDNILFIDENSIRRNGLVSLAYKILSNGKNIDLETIKQFKICVEHNGNIENSYIIFPFFYKNNIVYYVKRNLSLLKEYRKYYNASKQKGETKYSISDGIVYNIQNNNSIVIFVESILDCLRLPNYCIATLNCNISEKQIEFVLKYSKREAIVYLMDNYYLENAAFENLESNLKKIIKVINICSPKTKLYVFDYNNSELLFFKDLSRYCGEININTIMNSSVQITADNLQLLLAKIKLIRLS